MAQIRVMKKTDDELKELGVVGWGTWEKEPSTFDWEYDDDEAFYVLEGAATVKEEGGDEVSFGKGDFVTCPKGLKCTWTVKEHIRKKYKFG